MGKRKLVKVRALVLDGIVGRFALLRREGIDLKMTREVEDLGSENVYVPDGKILMAVREITAYEEVDVVIIGNNLGAGIEKAQSVDGRMRDRTIIVWNTVNHAEARKYAELGFKHFGSRTQLADLIKQALRTRFF